MPLFEELDIKTVGAVLASLFVIIGYVGMVFFGIVIPETFNNLVYIAITFLFGVGGVSIAGGMFSKILTMQANLLKLQKEEKPI